MRVRHPASIVGLLSTVPGVVSPTSCWLFSGEAFRFGEGPPPVTTAEEEKEERIPSDHAVYRGPPSWTAETRDDARGDPCASAPVAIREAEVPGYTGQDTSVLPVWRGPALNRMAFVDRESSHLVREMEIRVWRLEYLGSPSLVSMEFLRRRERIFQCAAAWAQEFQDDAEFLRAREFQQFQDAAWAQEFQELQDDARFLHQTRLAREKEEARLPASVGGKNSRLGVNSVSEE